MRNTIMNVEELAYNIWNDISNEDVFLDISVDPELDVEAEMIQIDDDHYEINLRSIDVEHLRTTVAHELIHVHQYVRGDLIDYNGKMFWKGEVVDTSVVPYMELPWEIEAYLNEEKY